MFQALLAHLQETLHEQQFVYCVRVMSVGCCLGWSGTVVRFRAGARDAQTGYGTLSPATYLEESMGCFPGVGIMKQIWHPYTIDIKNMRIYTFTDTYAFMLRTGTKISQQQYTSTRSQMK
jgi:hypothetical protein